MTNTPFQDTIEKALDNFLELNHRWDTAEQVEKYIQKWRDLLETIKDETEHGIVEAYISALEGVDTDNDYPEFNYGHDREENEDWLARNSEIMTAIEMCNIEY